MTFNTEAKEEKKTKPMKTVEEATQEVPQAAFPIRFFGDVTTDVQFNNIGVHLTEGAPVNAVLMNPITLTALLQTVKGGLSITAHDDAALDPLKSRVHKLEGVLCTVQKFFDDYGVEGPGGTISIEFEDESNPPEEVQQGCLDILRESVEIRPYPELELQLAHSLALSVAKNIVYESLIDELSEYVQCSEGSAEDIDDEKEQEQDVA